MSIYDRPRNDKMSGAAKPAASRAGKTAAGAWSKRAGRIDGCAWRDAERALRLGRKHDVHAVEVHGMRFVLRFAKQPQVEPTRGRGADDRAPRQRIESTREQAPQATRAPNSAQRRSRRRMEAFLTKKRSGEGCAPSPPTAAVPTSSEPARVEPDARAGDATMDEVTEGSRGQKRAADEASVCANTPSAGPQGPRQVEPTGRSRFSRGGLQPLHMSPEERRRENAAAALDNQRSARGRG